MPDNVPVGSGATAGAGRRWQAALESWRAAGINVSNVKKNMTRSMRVQRTT